jgi:hypothetical protein
MGPAPPIEDRITGPDATIAGSTVGQTPVNSLEMPADSIGRRSDYP